MARTAIFAVLFATISLSSGPVRAQRWVVLPGQASASTEASVATSGSDTAAPSVPPPPDATAAPANADDAAKDGDGSVLLVVPTDATGLAPVVSLRATALARDVAAELGYHALDDGAANAAAAATQMPFPPTPADLWRATYAAHAQRGLFIQVRAEQGRYVIDALVASLDGMGPFVARGTSTEKDFDAVVTGCVRQVLPAPGSWRGYDHVEEIAQTPPPPAAPPDFIEEDERSSRPLFDSHEPMSYRFRLSIGGVAAYGVSPKYFYNEMAGTRFDVRLSPELAMGVGIHGVNLDANDENTGNVLPYLMVEDRLRIANDAFISFPLRITAGYLPDNGPVFGLSAGILLPIGYGLELEFDLISPTFWVLPETTAVSFNVGMEVGFGF